MEKQRTRQEIDEKYKWDLTSIYKNDDEFKLEHEKVKEEVEILNKYKGKIVSNAKKLYEYLSNSDLIERKLYKLYYYAHLKHDEDTTNPKYQELLGQINNTLQRHSEITSYVIPEMLSITYDKVKEFYKEESKLLDYEFNLECIYRYKEHTLDENQEKILSSLSKIFENPENIYSHIMQIMWLL